MSCTTGPEPSKYKVYYSLYSSHAELTEILMIKTYFFIQQLIGRFMDSPPTQKDKTVTL